MTFLNTCHGRIALSLAICLCLAAPSATFGQAPDKSGASNGRTPWTKSRIKGSPEPPEPYRIVSAFPKLKFEKPTSIEELTGTNRMLVTEMSGKVFTFEKRPDIAEKDLVVDLRELLPKDLAAKGVSLFDAELHPKFKENRFLYLCYVHPAGHTRVSRFTLSAEVPSKAVADSEQVVITWPSGGHNAGCLEFGTDGYLYISTGDGAGPNPPDGLTTGQDVSDLLGAILRIDVDHRPVGNALGGVPPVGNALRGVPKDAAYSVPADNPFVGQKDARPEIWAYGLRNPWKFGVDPNSGDIFAADNGWESWEMVHRIVRGGNYGWPIMEGRATLRSEVKPGPTPILPPVKDHPHTEANSVIGGPVYRGEKLPGLAGSFVYGDYITGTIWSVRREKDDSYSHQTLVDTDQRIVAFTQGSGGELFVLDYDYTGQIYELLPSNLKDTSATFPRKLSETGLFRSVETLEPAAGVEPYSVLIERWMDGAKGQRWVAIPGNGRITLAKSSQTEPTVYPDGTVFVKQINLPLLNEEDEEVRLETQILYFENGTWHPQSFLWDADGKDAVRVESIGKNRTTKGPDRFGKTNALIERTWHVNAVNECKLCHNAESRHVLGFVPNQLNIPNPDNDQLGNLVARGVLSKKPEIAADDPLRLVDPYSSPERYSFQAINERARSYLHVNCSMCHQPGGNAIVGFYLRRDMPFEKLNTNRGTGIGTFGMRDAKVIVPGDPYRSVLLYRMSKLGYARMPYIGSQVVDGHGVVLIEEWIREMPPVEGSGPKSGPATKDSVDAKALQSLLSDDATNERRKEALGQLVKTTEGSLALVGEMHRFEVGAIPLLPYFFRRQDRQEAVKMGAASSGNIRGLFDTFLPESQRRATLGASIDPKAILARTGDASRGKLIFFSDGARCKACHDLDDRTLSLGPTLREIKKKYPTAAELVQHVLQPSLKIEEPFAAHIIRTDDGQVLSGMIVENTPKEVVLKTTERKVIRIARENIEDLKKSEKSLMPDGILADLTAQEAADLIEYVRGLEAAK